MSTQKTTSLLSEARRAQKRAYAPYSKFKVGAALLTADDAVYTGCNIENSSFGLTVCAERVAVFKAVSAGKMNFNTIVLVTDSDEFCPPCGACRQVLAEFNPDLKIILSNSKGDTRQTNLKKLLPEAFNQNFLKNL